ncbi:oligosaccharide deacetylase [Lysinibacillus xylanilyticus]|uniref:Oligosaccharide deacetylase n=1 Tax=Lysinibacillus xylanilyticus TaxID=582475 RepID=A0A0K9FH52_9BACI|nr:polysaccharide deacetylase family protein [Lysinibacillus xylanilyticus]KMY33830.1 oligosaccharide deacetylase [Lysinibacillus xylanilyticus]
MTRKYILFLSLCFLIISVFFTGRITYADKGRPYYEETGEVVWDINTKDKIIALTFDDGPHPKYTAAILDLLAKYDAKATFFIIGKNAEKYPDLVLRSYSEGHELANHTYSHPFKASVAELHAQLRKTKEIIYGITGFSPVLFRPVGGNYNDQMINAAVKDGYKVVMWSWHQDTQDWKQPGVNKIVQKVMKGSKPGDVILFHDGGGDRMQTIKALEEILPELKKQGYTFVTISELIKSKQQQEKVQ